MKYLLSLTAMVVVFASFDQASAQDQASVQDNVLCDTSWWQHLQEEDIDPENEDINNNNLYEKCNEDGDTPLIIAYRAKVSDTVILNILNLVALNAVRDIITAQNAHGESFITMLLKEEYEGEEKEAGFFIDIDVNLGVIQGGF